MRRTRPPRAHPRLVMPAAVRRAIVAHARRDAPRECCGFLVGRSGRVVFAVAARNLEPGRTRYRVDPREHIALRRALRASMPPLDIVGVYHSHPASPPTPSPTDIADAHYPDWIHVIVGLGLGLGLGQARVRAFQIAHGRARTIALTARRESKISTRKS